MHFGIRQYVYLPKGSGFDGVQCLIVGRTHIEHIDKDDVKEYRVRWLDQNGQPAEATFDEKRLKKAQRKAKKAAKKAVKKKRR